MNEKDKNKIGGTVRKETRRDHKGQPASFKKEALVHQSRSPRSLFFLASVDAYYLTKSLLFLKTFFLPFRKAYKLIGFEILIDWQTGLPSYILYLEKIVRKSYVLVDGIGQFSVVVKDEPPSLPSLHPAGRKRDIER